MIRRGVIAVLVTLLMLPAGSRARPAAGGEAPPQADTTSLDSSTVASSGSLLFLPDHFYRMSTTLTFSMRPHMSADRLYGFERYKASPLECAYQGAGMGMTLGMAAGAFGMMAGAWDERETWYIAGAMAALGSLYGGIFKADDPKWNLRIRVEPDR